MNLIGKTALITGAAKRIGAQTAMTLHQNGANIIIHYGRSESEAEDLITRLNAQRPDSALAPQADLLNMDEGHHLAIQAFNAFDGLDILVNNASNFYPTPIGTMNEENWNDLMGSNIKAPLFLSQACYPALKQNKGVIINMIDIHSRTPLKDHTMYSCAKAAKAMLTRSLALEMAPDVRVNGVSPGAIMWPENESQNSPQNRTTIIDQIPLERIGKPVDITDTILFLIGSDYINGQIITVDGGRQLF